MSVSAMDILKERLARGEINADEYYKLAATIQGDQRRSVSVDDVKNMVRHGVLGVGSSAANAIKGVFGSYTYNDPTDSSPMEITKDFTIYGTYFKFKEKPYDLNHIESIEYKAVDQSINFVPMGTDSYLVVRFFGGEECTINGFSMFITGKKNKLIACANHILTSRTYEQRLTDYGYKLRKPGGIQLGKVSITPDGYLVEGNLRVHLKTAAKRNLLQFGTVRSGWGMQIRPSEIAASESGFGMLSNYILLDASRDRDVIFPLVAALAGL